MNIQSAFYAILPERCKNGDKSTFSKIRKHVAQFTEQSDLEALNMITT